MSIDNSRDFLAYMTEIGGYIIAEHLLVGSNIQVPFGTWTPSWETGEVDSITFMGTAGNDALFGGGGELFAFFIGTRGSDLYGAGGNPDAFSSAYVDYSSAPTGVFVDMSYRGSRTFTDAEGETRTVDIVGKARDGLGSSDYFAESAEEWGAGFSSVMGVFGSSYRDVMIGGGGFDDFYGGGGDDVMIGGSSHGGAGDDRLVGRSVDGSSVVLVGDEGSDWILGTDGPGRTDVYLIGGGGNDHIFAGAGDDTYLTGDAGRDFIDAGAGNDYVDGGVGADTLFSGAGNDTINPDLEYFWRNSSQPRDGARDLIFVTADDVGDFNDVILFNAFEAGRDQIRFGDAVRGGLDFRVSHEAAGTGVNTVLQIDQDGDGFGAGTPDDSDYFLTVGGADLSLHHGHILT